jgi:hypothetical protein
LGQRAPSPPTGHGGEGRAPAEAIALAKQVTRKRTLFRGSTLLTKELTVLGGQIPPYPTPDTGTRHPPSRSAATTRQQSVRSHAQSVRLLLLRVPPLRPASLHAACAQPPGPSLAPCSPPGQHVGRWAQHKRHNSRARQRGRHAPPGGDAGLALLHNGACLCKKPKESSLFREKGEVTQSIEVFLKSQLAPHAQGTKQPRGNFFRAQASGLHPTL